jgi:predicted nucleic acid-binding protein
MANKLFLDTNIILDFILKREFELSSTEEIINSAFDKKLDIYISESVITNSIYLLRLAKIDRLETFRDLCRAINVLPFNRNLLYMPLEKFRDIEDGMLYFLAAHHKLDYFITRNKKDFPYTTPSLPVLTPDEFTETIFHK